MSVEPEPHTLDPSAATQEQNTRAIQALRVETNEKLIALRDVLVTRFEGGDKATVLLAETVNRVPTLLDRETARLSTLFDEKLVAEHRLTSALFVNVTRSFDERDKRTEQRKLAVDSSVSAAFAAQKEAAQILERSNAAATAKSDIAFHKQMEDLKSLFASKTASTDEKIATIGDRITRIEFTKTGTNAALGGTVTAIMTFVAVVSAIFSAVTLIMLLMRR
jgi:hypothetical protein